MPGPAVWQMNVPGAPNEKARLRGPFRYSLAAYFSPQLEEPGYLVSSTVITSRIHWLTRA